MKPVRKRVVPRPTISETVDSDAETFAWVFSHSGALKIAEIANREIRAAKARLRELGINPEDPSSKDDPDSIEE